MAPPKLGHATLHLFNSATEEILTTEDDYKAALAAVQDGGNVSLPRWGWHGGQLSVFEAAPGTVLAIEFRT